MAVIAARAQTSYMDFTSGFGTLAPADGTDLHCPVPRACTITDILIIADANPPSVTVTLTVTVNSVSVATGNLHTDGSVTKTGLPITLAQGDNLRVLISNSGSPNAALTGFAYALKGTAK